MDEIRVDTGFMIDRLRELLVIPSVTGNTRAAIRWLAGEFGKLGLESRVLAKGGLLVKVRGGSGNATAYLAHVDTLGAVVKEIKGNGRLKFSRVGGYMLNAVEGENCLIETMDGHTFTGTVMTTQPSTHIHNEATKLERSEANMEVRLDEKVASADDVRKLGIEVGDFVSFDPRVTVTHTGFIKSRHLDDKAGVAALLGAAQYFSRQAPPSGPPVYFYITVHEEIGHGASAGLPEDVVRVIAVDMGAAGEGQASDEFGTSICAKDSTGPYDLDLRRHLIGLSRVYSIRHKVDVYPFYGSDAGAALRAGLDVATGLIGPGVNASHAYERTHRDAIEATAQLVVASIIQPDAL